MVDVDAARATTEGLPTPIRRSPSEGGRRRRALVIVGVAVALVTVGVAGLTVGLGSAPPGPPRSSIGIAEDRAVPSWVLDIPLVDQHGATTSLSALRGKVVVLASFLTSCQETCPLTTGLFLQMQRSMQAAGVGGEVVLVEASVDPDRDTPARLAAYERVTRADWAMLTGTPGNLAALWRYFGVFSQKVAEGTPPGLDWQSGRPYTYDVNHSDGFMVLDRSQHLRFLTGAAPDDRGHRLPGTLKAMLSGHGLRDLSSPGSPAWTASDGLQAISWVIGRTVPVAS
jgi:protein SCO1/2